MKLGSKLFRESRKYGFHEAAEIASVLYLLLPLLLFSLGWLKPGLAFVACLIALISFVSFVRHQPGSKPKVSIAVKHKKTVLVVAVLAAFSWTLLGGIGGYGYQSADYDKHNAIASDLITHHWPVQYDITTPTPEPLVYYTGYYLPAAAVGKVLNVRAANLFSVVWAASGILLCFYWLFRLVKRAALPILLVFIFFSGLDIAGQLLVKHSWPGWHFIALEWYSTIWQYSSNATQLNWVPQHAIAAWLTTSIVLSSYVERWRKSSVIFLFSLGLLFSPLTAIGLFPLLVLAMWPALKNIRSAISFENIVFPLFFGVIIGLYMLAGTGSYPKQFIWQYNLPGLHDKWILMAAFMIFDFGIYALLLYRFIKTQAQAEWRHVYWVMLGVLVLLPFYRFGFYNDSTMRISIPMLFVLCVLLLRLLYHAKNLRLKLAVALALLIGAVNPMIEYNIHLTETPVPRHGWGDTLDGPIRSGPFKYFVDQYYGDPHSIFFRYIARN